MSDLNATTQIVIIFAAAALSQVLSWFLGLPRIVFYLVCGICIGPIARLISVDSLFGGLQESFVTLGVAFILFEGGMSLKFGDISQVRGVVLRLISIGAAITLIGVAAAAFLFLHLSIPASLVLGAIFMVTGPTVVIPLLPTLRPRTPLGSILRWEGILIDPVGVVCAVLMAEAVVNDSLSLAPIRILWGLALSIVAGVGVGLIAGWLLLSVLRKHWLPDDLHVPMSFLALFGGYWCAEVIHPESGLLTATLLGMMLARLGGHLVDPIVEFTERTQPVLLAILFIVLAAGLDISHVQIVSFSFLIFVVIILAVVRPLAVFAATKNSALDVRGKLLLSAIAPRGIVAASMASVLSEPLIAAHIPGAESIEAYTFLTIIASVIFCSLFSSRICSALGLRQDNPQGVLIVGAQGFQRDFAEALRKWGVKVILLDTDRLQITAAKRRELTAFVGNALSDTLREELDLEGIGRVAAMTSNDEANTLVAVQYAKRFGYRAVYQLRAAAPSSNYKEASARGRLLFSRAVSLDELEDMRSRGYAVQSAAVGEGETIAGVLSPQTLATNESKESAVAKAIVLAIRDTKGTVQLCSADSPLSSITADEVIFFGPTTS